MVTPAIPAPIDMTNLDFDAAFGRLVELIGSVYPWLDLDSRGEVARLHLEAMAHQGAHFHFYLNRLGQESRWGTATERSHLLSLVKLIGYRPATPAAATATVVFTLSTPAAAAVPFPAGTFVRTEDAISPVRFQLLAPLVIPTGSSAASGLTENSVSNTETYVSDGKPFQRFRLGSSPYLDGTLQITTALGTWTEVTNFFLASKPTDRHFMTTVDSQDRVTVVFGNNRTGAIPIGPIAFTYKTGGGIAGRLPPGALSAIEGTFADANGNSVSVSVTNPAKTDGGDDRESEAQIKINAPSVLATAGRAVARTDYEAIARQVPGVAFALMLTRNQDPAVLENEGFLFVVPTDGSVADLPLLTAVAQRFGDNVAVGSGGVYLSLPTGPTPKTTTFQLRVRPAAYLPIDLYVKAFLRKGAASTTVGPAITAAFQAYFAPMVSAASVGLGTSGQVPNPRINFGYYLQDKDGNPTGHFPISDIAQLVGAVPGVRELGDGPDDLALNGAPRNVQLATYQFPVAGSVTLLLA